MFKEMRGLEYAFEVLKALHYSPGTHGSRQIADLIKTNTKTDVSESYVQKVLPRMVKLGILTASEVGYAMVLPLKDITVNRLLDMCDMPDKTSPLYSLCSKLKQAVATVPVEDFYNFSK